MDVALIKELIAEEKTVLYAYDDATGEPVVPGYRMQGHVTVGTGRSLDTHGISAAEAAFLLDDDLASIQAALCIYPWWLALSPVRQFIVVDMCFNMGVSGMLGFPHMIAALFHGDYPAAAKEMLNSHWAVQLPARARRLAEAMRVGHFPT